MRDFKVQLIVLDVDGVLTDGNLLIGSNGVEYKSFNVKDGMGIGLARYYGIKVAIITGRESKSVEIRSRELNIDFLFQGVTNKKKVLNRIVDSLNINYENVFYMGDDINDLTVIREVGFSAAPKDAVKVVKESVNYVCSLDGGKGAVREAIDLILSEVVDYDKLLEEYARDKVGIQ